MKTVTIDQDGSPTSVTVAKLVTNERDRGRIAWVAEDEAKVNEVLIRANGEYLASNIGVYGFYKVSVNVPGGEDAKDENGEVKQPEPPSYGTETYTPYDLPGTYVPWDMTPAYGDGTYVIGLADDGKVYKVTKSVDPETNRAILTKEEVTRAVESSPPSMV
jgi:hypothetical protein